jgi:hypothetical protein
MSRRTELKWLIVLLAVALFVRSSNLMYRLPISGDEISYRQVAVNIISGKGFYEDKSEGFREGAYYAWRYPGYCYFLAGTFLPDPLKASGNVPPRSTIAAQILMSMLGCYLLYSVSRQLVGPRAGLISLALIALYIPQIRLPGRLFSENLSLPLYLLFWHLYLSFIRHPRFLNVFATGVCAGIVGLCRETALAFGLVALMTEVAIRIRAGNLRRIVPVLSIFPFILLALSPWMIRNYRIFHRLTSITTNAPVNIYYGAQPNATGFSRVGKLGPPHSLVLAEPPGTIHAHDPARGIYEEIEIGRAQLRASWEYVRDNPLAWTLLGFKKAAYSWALPSMTFLNPRSFVEKLITHVWDVYYVLILVPGLIGAWRLRHRLSELSPGYSLLLMPTLIAMITVVLTRYRMPTDIALIFFAGAQVAFWWEKGRSHSFGDGMAGASPSG